MKVAVDPVRCQGHARCWDLSPEVFSLDEEGHGFAPVADIPDELAAKAEEAARNCPERAITIS
jgi:ferredoxin